MGGTFGSMVHETDAFFSVMHLQDFIREGQWREAIAYLSRFIQLHDYRLVSLEAQVLHRFLFAHQHLADILADTQEGRNLAVFFREYRRHDSTVRHGTIRLRSIMLTVLHAKQHLRVTFDWERVRRRAAKIAYKLVHRIPELKRVVALPAGPMKPRNVLPIRTCTGPRFRRKKLPCQPQASALAKRYLQRRGSLLSSSHSKESDNNDLSAKATSWVADILDECLQAGKPPGLHQKRPLKTSGKQDECLQAGNLELHQKGKLQTSGKQGACNNPSISQSMSGTITDHAINHVALSMREAGATSALVIQALSGAMAGRARNPGIQLAANAGEFAGHVLSPGAPFSTTLGTTVSQTSPARNSRVSLMKNAGTTKHLSQGGCSAEGAEKEFNNANKNLREVTAASDERNHHPKRQRTNGASAEASPQ